MFNLKDAACRANLAERLSKIQDESLPKWGKFSVPAMVCHLADTLEMAAGLRPVAAVPVPAMMRYFPLKHLILYVLPMPKGLPTAPELLVTVPSEWAADCRRVQELLKLVGELPKGQGAPHPAFGRLSNDEWKVLQARHMDHHLRQFGQ